MLLALKMEEAAVNQECRWSLEAGKDKETGFPLDPPKETQPCLLLLDLRPPEL